MAKVSLQTQLAALDAVILILRRHQLPPRSQAELLAEQLAPQRDHLSRELAEFLHNADNRHRTRMRERLRAELEK